VFLELMMDENATLTSRPDEIVPTLVEKEAAIMRHNSPAPEAQLFTKKGGRGGRGSKVGKSPKRNKRDDKRDNKGDKEKDFRKWCHCQWQRHSTENCLSKECGDPQRSADTAAKASPETDWTLTTSIQNNWMVSS
jgi:hypothetical protein